MANSLLSMSSNFGIQLLLITFVLILFYNYVKKFIFNFSPSIAAKTKMIENYPLNHITGVIELSIVAVCHVIFCSILLYFLHIDIISIFGNISFLDCIFGILIGIGSVGISILLCTVGMKILESINSANTPKTIDGWKVVANAGWIRHHKHTIKILPFPLALIIITMQIGSEEIIFRTVLTTIFQPFGIVLSFLVATTLFIYMQTLHMPSKTSAMFPVVGATVMGITHGILYLYNPSIIPLILSHLAFFIFTIL